MTGRDLPPLSRQAQSYRDRRADQHMFTVIVGMTRDERQASQVVAEANQNLLQQTEGRFRPLACTAALAQLSAVVCATTYANRYRSSARGPWCGGVAAAKQGGWPLLPRHPSPDPRRKRHTATPICLTWAAAGIRCCLRSVRAMGTTGEWRACPTGIVLNQVRPKRFDSGAASPSNLAKSSLRPGRRCARSQATFTFQKIGAPNLRTSRTLFLKAVGWTHSPHGT